ncbi:MAG: alanine--tRNA ligase [Bacteroidota bacterium]
MKSSSEIREIFLDFFKQKQHQIVPSAPIVVKNDPSLMFTNAGMNQFKDIFLGSKSPKSKRYTDTQKCLRASGKHNDLDDVGHDTYHHTMFEMLGNWSFGDYYKKEAIAWAWELLTKRFNIPEDRLYVTVFGGDKGDGLQADTEAEKEWEKWIAKDRILHFGKKDNFWEMGAIGPSGPCSEIHVDIRSEAERQKIDGKTLVNADHPEVIEIWNLVFIQYNRKADQSLEALQDKHIDTGMGFERVVMVLQGKKSTYDIDLFDRTRSFLQKRTGIAYATATDEQQIAIRVIIDHIRAISFTIADGQLPSNTGAGYVIRRILRRASRYAYTFLKLEVPFMYEMVGELAKEYKNIFPELASQQEFISKIILEEEKGFLKKLETGTTMFEQYLTDKPNQNVIDGAFAFKLYDTYGFPIDLTGLMAREKGKAVDMVEFEKLLNIQKDRSRKATELNTEDWVVVHESEALPVFRGYDVYSLSTRILQYRTVTAKKKKLLQLVLQETPFYSESGGQVGDKGTLTQGGETIRVLDTVRENELIIHLVDKFPQNPTGEWIASISEGYRKSVTQNHSATHLLHAALRDVLGTHVEQRGSQVSAKGLRFDFSHFEKISEEELKQIETQVNERIAAGIPLEEFRDVPIEEAKGMGAMALFGEKYGDRVRVIVFDQAYSVELCGGTHVANTQEIRLFKLISESSVAAGIRRVEAYTGEKALSFYREKEQTLNNISALLKAPKDLERAVRELADKYKGLEKELQKLNGEKIGRLKSELKGKATPLKDIQVIKEIVEVSSSDDLKQLSFDLKKTTENTIIALGAVINAKPILSIILSDDLANTNRFHAGNMVRELAKAIKGGGGGQAFYATAGGKNPEGLEQALQQLDTLIE